MIRQQGIVRTHPSHASPQNYLQYYYCLVVYWTRRFHHRCLVAVSSRCVSSAVWPQLLSRTLRSCSFRSSEALISHRIPPLPTTSTVVVIE